MEANWGWFVQSFLAFYVFGDKEAIFAHKKILFFHGVERILPTVFDMLQGKRVEEQQRTSID